MDLRSGRWLEVGVGESPRFIALSCPDSWDLCPGLAGTFNCSLQKPSESTGPEYLHSGSQDLVQFSLKGFPSHSGDLHNYPFLARRRW